MALREAARFFDLSEAQAAAGLLRSGDVIVHVEREFEGAALGMIGQFSPGGGYALWVPESDWEAARTVIDDLRRPKTTSRSTYDAGAMLATTATMLVVLLVGPLGAWAAVAAMRRRDWVRWTAIVLLGLLVLELVLYLAAFF